jgi:hypothetical protein
VSYRPITDVWFLARAKLKNERKYYGAYLGGFPERARALLSARLDEPVLHVCGGLARYYPYEGGFGPQDKTLDLDPNVEPDFLRDAREPFPQGFRAYLCDPPYSETEAENYTVGSSVYPTPNQLVRNGIDALPLHGRVGIIHYILPKCPSNAKFIAAIGVLCGFNNRIRIYSVFEKVK